MAESAAKDERMAAEERLLLALNTLKTLIEAPAGERREASLRRQLTAVRAKWSAYDTAHFVYLKKIQADEDRLAERGTYNGQYETTEGILERAELLLDEFAAAAAPLPVDNDVIFNIASQEQALFYTEARKEVASVEARLAEVEEGAARTKQELETLDKELDGVVEQMAAAALLSKQMIKGKPEMAEGILRGEGETTSELKEKIAKQRRTIASRIGAVVEPVTVNGNRNGRDHSYMYERRKLPKFEGARRDYPSFRREWQTNVGGGQFSAEYELREIKQNTPSEVEPDLKNLKTIVEVWEVLDRKYGRTMELASELISGLQNFKPSYKAKTESACFAEMDREWTKVYNDLEEVQKLEVLNHEPTLSGFAKKLPSVESKKAYIVLRLEMMQECEEANPPTVLSELEVMKKFMKAERRRQELLEGLIDEKDQKIREPQQGAERKDPRQCYECGEVGHDGNECPAFDGSRYHVRGNSHSNYQPVALPCPACNQKHTYINKNGEEMPSTKLGFLCPAFNNLSVNERVALLERVNGCAGCLDFTGRHQRDNCWSMDRDGVARTCPKEINGVRCGKRHHVMLHGSTNNFANYVQMNRCHVNIAASTDEERKQKQTAVNAKEKLKTAYKGLESMMDTINKLKQLKKLQQAIEEVQRDAEEAHSTKNEVLQQSKDLEEKIKVMEADLAQMQEDLSAAERRRRTVETERDELAEELCSAGSKGALAISEKQRLDARIAVLEGELEEEQTQSEMLMECAKKDQISIEQLTTEFTSVRGKTQKMENSKVMLERQKKELKVQLEEVENSNRAKATVAIVAIVAMVAIVALESKVANLREQLSAEAQERMLDAKLEKTIKELLMQFEDERRHGDSGQAEQYKEQNERKNGRMKVMRCQLDDTKEENEAVGLMNMEVAKGKGEHNREKEEGVVQRPEAEEGGLLEERYEENVIRPSMGTHQGEKRSEKYEQRSPDVKVGEVVPVKGDVRLIRLETKEGRLSRVQEEKVSEDGLVRTMAIIYRVKRKLKVKVVPYVPVPLTGMEVAVQKLVLLVPGEKVAGGEKEEAWAEG